MPQNNKSVIINTYSVVFILHHDASIIGPDIVAVIEITCFIQFADTSCQTFCDAHIFTFQFSFVMENFLTYIVSRKLHDNWSGLTIIYLSNSVRSIQIFDVYFFLQIILNKFYYYVICVLVLLLFNSVD